MGERPDGLEVRGALRWRSGLGALRGEGDIEIERR